MHLLLMKLQLLLQCPFETPNEIQQCMMKFYLVINVNLCSLIFKAPLSPWHDVLGRRVDRFRKLC